MVVAASCYGDAFQQQGLGNRYGKQVEQVKVTTNGAKYRQILKENLLHSANTIRLE
jgi:hypothetical protein